MIQRTGTGLLLAVALLLTACERKAENGNPEKWRSYEEKAAEKDRALRARLNVRRRTTYILQWQDSQRVTVKTGVTEFNRQGRMVREQKLDAETGAPRMTTTQEWAGGRLLTMQVRQNDGPDYEAAYAHDDGGRRTREVITALPAGDTLLVRSYRYDFAGNETEARLDDRRRALVLRKVSERDSAGRPVRVAEYEGDKLNWEEKYTYDGKGFTCERRSGGGALQSVFRTLLDDDGLCTEVRSEDEQGRPRMHIRFHYDEQGRLKSQEYLGKQGQPLQVYSHERDEKGLILKTEMTTPQAPEGLVTTFEYEFFE